MRPSQAAPVRPWEATDGDLRPAEIAESGWMREAYALESANLMRRRLLVCALLPPGFLGLATVLQSRLEPAMAGDLWRLYLVQALICLLCAAGARGVASATGLQAVALATLCALVGTMAWSAGLGGLSPQSFALGLACTLNGAAVLLPWGPLYQAGAGVFVLLVFWAFVDRTAPGSIGADPGVALSLLAAFTTSFAASHVLVRHRRETFQRSAQLWREWIRKQEEADISAALVYVGETLSANVGKSDLLGRVNRLAVELVDCDWSATFLLDEDRGVYRLCAEHSSARGEPEAAAITGEVEFAEDALSLIEVFRSGSPLTVASCAEADAASRVLARERRVTSVVYAPICLGSRVIGVVIDGLIGRTAHFSSKQKRLSMGIAHATAIALANERLVRDLRDANRVKSEFVATMSHELRTPLNVIAGYGEMLDDGGLGPLADGQRDAIRRIRRSARELLELVDATLDLRRLEAGHDVVRASVFDLGELCAEIGAEVESLQRPGVELCWPGSGDLAAPIRADRAKLKTIVKNLVGNALKFTSRGRVVVSLERGAFATRIRVDDTGIGIPAHSIETIFEMFRQVDGSETRRFSGVGLGLYIVQRLAEQMGGVVAVTSEEGVGSTFVVTLPHVVASGAPSSNGAAGRATPPGASPMPRVAAR